MSRPQASHIEAFESCRERLRRLAYRLLGTVEDADDALQEAYIKWADANSREIRSAESWLVTVLTRICIDRMRAKARELAHYTGSWLPGPLYVDDPIMPDQRLDMTADLSMALLVLLERLTPEERAVYLLHDIFDFNHFKISTVIGKSQESCRQLLSRARKHVREGRPRFAAPGDAKRSVIEKFLEALANDDERLLMNAIAHDATITSDGGGKVRAALRVVQGRDRICRLLLGVRKKIEGKIEDRLMRINGEAGIVSYVDGVPRALFVMETSDTEVVAVFRVLNPEKLRSIPALNSPGLERNFR
jgi:RNA polymerase sigma-70 factor, ECF subfamily